MGTLSRPSQGKAGGWEVLSGDQKGPFKDAAACSTDKMLVLSYLGSVLKYLVKCRGASPMSIVEMVA